MARAAAAIARRPAMPERHPLTDDVPFRAVFDAAANAMLLVDDTPRLVAVNAAAAALLRYPDGALDGTHVAEVSRDGDGAEAGAVAAAWRATLAAGAGRHGLIGGDGTPTEVRLHVTREVVDGVHLVIVEPVEADGPTARLTARQRDTLRLLCDGATNQQIAAALGISEPTVQKHIASIKERLGATTRAQVVALALRERDLARRLSAERLYVHQAIRDAAGAIADTRLIYVSHEARRQEPEIVPHVGREVSSWYPGYRTSELLRMIAEAIDGGAVVAPERVLIQPPWPPHGYEFEAVCAPIGPERAVFVAPSPIMRHP